MSSIDGVLPCFQLITDIVEDPDTSREKKIYGFAILMIVGICGLVLMGIGIASYHKLGILSALNTKVAFGLVSLGSFLGPIEFLIGMNGLVRSCRLNPNQPN